MNPVKYLFHLIRPEFIHRPSQVVRAMRHKFRPSQGWVDAVLPWGLSLKVNPDKYIGRRALGDRIYALEACETSFRLSEPGDLALDIGANQGLGTSAMALQVGAEGKVMAIEMMPNTYEKLKGNVSS